MSPSDSSAALSTDDTQLAFNQGKSHPHLDTKIRLAYQDCRGRFFFPRPEISANQRTNHAIDQCRTALVAYTSRMVFGYHLFGPAFSEPVVETATISAVRLNDIEAAHFPYEVILADREPAPELTALFHGYAVALGMTTSFAEQYPDMITGLRPPCSGHIQKVTAVRYQLKQGVILRVVLLSLLVSALVSVIIGLKTEDIQNAFAAFGAMTLLVTIPLSVIFGMGR